MGHPVPISGTEVVRALEARSREPFLDVLRDLLEARPDAEAVRKFADKCPDRWAQAVAIFGRLAGYHDKLEVDTGIALNVAAMSDAELMDELERLQVEVRDQGEGTVVSLASAKGGGSE